MIRIQKVATFFLLKGKSNLFTVSLNGVFKPRPIFKVNSVSKFVYLGRDTECEFVEALTSRGTATVVLRGSTRLVV